VVEDGISDSNVSDDVIQEEKEEIINIRKGRSKRKNENEFISNKKSKKPIEIKLDTYVICHSSN
jgi:hypothetical protein